MTYIRSSVVLLLALCAVLWPVDRARAQGVTTGTITGIVVNNQQQPVAGANVIVIHEPSGTTYEGVTRADGRFSIPAMRVGGPYTVTVAYVGTGGTAFAPETRADIAVTLGVRGLHQPGHVPAQAPRPVRGAWRPAPADS